MPLPDNMSVPVSDDRLRELRREAAQSNDRQVKISRNELRGILSELAALRHAVINKEIDKQIDSLLETKDQQRIRELEARVEKLERNAEIEATNLNHLTQRVNQLMNGLRRLDDDDTSLDERLTFPRPEDVRVT